MKKRTSLIWFISKEKLIDVVNDATSISEILSHFGLLNKGGNYRTLKQRLDEDDLDYSHIKLGLHSNSGRAFKRIKTSLKDILIENSTFDRSHLKLRLLKENILLNECVICKQPPLWNGKPLSLQLDHINGISDDNRLENLRILCPHCHSQTENFAGKNKKDKSKKSLGQLPSQLASNCRNQPRINSRKVNRPTKEELNKLLWEKPTTEIAKQFGVSDKAIGKWAKSYRLIKPSVGYWQKKKSA